MVRDPARLDVPAHERLEVVTANVFEPPAILPAVSGHERVISALGPRDRGHTTICRDGTRSIMSAMDTAGVRRLGVVSNSGMHTDGDGVFVRRIVKPILIRVLRKGYEDMGIMEDRDRSYHEQRGGYVRGRVMMSRANLADYVLRAAADDALTGTAPFVANG